MAAEQRESMSLQDVLPHLSQQRSREPDAYSDAYGEEDDWSGESSDAGVDDANDPDCFVVDDEALAQSAFVLGSALLGAGA